ncbi:MAG: hypothetical protein LUF29_07805 [Oscillospiraceae bacterium]|nr:hypothetical protein [Oscillospiraceae bacterium]
MCNLSQGVYERGIEKGIQQGVERGETSKAKAMAISMHRDGMKEEQIAKYANVDVELVRKWLGFSLD